MKKSSVLVGVVLAAVVWVVFVLVAVDAPISTREPPTPDLRMVFDFKPLPDIHLPKEGLVVRNQNESTSNYVISPKTGEEVIPGIDFYADGRVIIITSKGKRIDKRIDGSALRALLDHLNSKGMFAMTAAGIEMRRRVQEETGDVNIVTDSNTSRVQITLADISASVEVYALDHQLEYNSAVPEYRLFQDSIFKIREVAGHLD